MTILNPDPPDPGATADGTTHEGRDVERDEDERRAWADGWAEGEAFVMENIWEYVLLRYWFGPRVLRIRSWWRWLRAGRPDLTPYEMTEVADG